MSSMSFRLGFICFAMLLNACSGNVSRVVSSPEHIRLETVLARALRAEQKGNLPESEKLLKDALIISSAIEDIPSKAIISINLARLYRHKHEITLSEQWSDKALECISDDVRIASEAYYEKALIKLAAGLRDQALEWAEKALATEQGELRGMRRNLLGRIELERGNDVLAGKHVSAALIENRSAGLREEEANALRMLGVIALHEKKHDDAERFLLDALALDKRLGKPLKIASDLEMLAALAQDRGRLTDAAGYLQRAREVQLAADNSAQIPGKSSVTIKPSSKP